MYLSKQRTLRLNFSLSPATKRVKSPGIQKLASVPDTTMCQIDNAGIYKKNQNKIAEVTEDILMDKIVTLRTPRLESAQSYSSGKIARTCRWQRLCASAKVH